MFKFGAIYINYATKQRQQTNTTNNIPQIINKLYTQSSIRVLGDLPYKYEIIDAEPQLSDD